MSSGSEKIKNNINDFRRKYYTNIFIRGSILTLSILVVYYLLVALLEYAFWLSPWIRLSIVLSFLLITIFCIHRFLKEPVQFWLAKKGIGDEESAQLIGRYFPEIKDRLVNLIQLLGLKDASVLAVASIEQKTKSIEPFHFVDVVDLRENRKYLKYLAMPIGIILLLIVINKSILTQSTFRIVNFNKEFAPQAPFNFSVQNKSLIAFFNEDFTLTLVLEGDAIPDACYLIHGSQRIKMESLGSGSFQYTFERLQEAKEIRFEAAGFNSSSYQVAIAKRPELTQLKLNLEFPKYLQRKNEQLINVGSIEVPEGTVANWEIQTSHTNNASFLLSSDNSVSQMQVSDNQHFVYKKGFTGPDRYEIVLENEHSKNKEKISYNISVIGDQHPEITVNNLRDSILYQRVVLGGVVADDYGLSRLALQYQVKNSNRQNVSQGLVTIPINRNQQQQSFFYNWSLDSLHLNPGEYLEYFLQVWDNDGVNGHKSTRSSVYSFFVPDKDQLVTDISKNQKKTEQDLEQTANKATELKKQIDDAQQMLKGKQSLDWQDKKKLEEILEQRKSLEQMINQLKEQNRLLDQKKDAFTNEDERIKEKAEQLQKLMNELLDDETKKLLEELEKLLRENADVNQMNQLLDKLNKNSNNLEKELERTLELFKQLQLEYKTDLVIKDLEQNIQDQKELQEKTEELEKELNSDKNNKKKNQEEGSDKRSEEKSKDLAEEQRQLSEDFKETQEKVDELKELGEEMNQNMDLPGEEDVQEVEENQQNSQEQLENNSPSQSKSSQQKAIQKMQQMKSQMESMQGSMSMEIDMQNLEMLRQIIHGLIKLSFDQEGLINRFRELEQNDPQFNHLAQQQLKLKDDVKVLEDSLLELGKRDLMMGSFVTREVTELNDHLDKAIDAYRERRRPVVATEMQYSMTSINNLALMLDSHFDQMMAMMQKAKAGMGKKKSKGKEQSLGEMQQMLNNKIEQLKNSGKSGRALSEELAEMAAEQERIRRALQEMQNNMKEKGGALPGGGIPEKMEETEIDLVNKKLTDELIKRQREILTRLLETEKSLREQDMEEERKGETANDYNKELPKALEDYLKLKEKEVELLKTVPPKLFPFYRNEVNEYFKRLREN